MRCAVTGEIFKRNRNFVTIEIRDSSQHSARGHLHRNRNPIAMHHKMQLELYENSKKYGDITLEIVSDKMKGEESICEPPLKRRKKTKTKSSADSTPSAMKASGVILRSASPVLEAMLSSDMKEKQEKVIEIHAESAKDVDDLLYYVIVHDLREDVNPLSLIKLAHFYSITSLFDACSARILVQLSVENFVESVSTFTRFEIECGYDKLVEFGHDHLEEIKQHDSFQYLGFAFKHGVLLVHSVED